MTDLITDAMVEAASEALHEESCPRSLRGAAEDCCDWTPWARVALESVAPAIAAKAWDEGYAMSERELDHAYGGHPICQDGPCDLCHECGTGNPYRAERIERGES